MGTAALEHQAAHGNQLGWAMMPHMTDQGANECVCTQAGCLIPGHASKPLFLIEKLEK